MIEKFFNWLERKLKVDTPYALSNWDAWRQYMKTHRPIAFFLTDDLPRLIDKINVYRILKINYIPYYFKNLISLRYCFLKTKLPIMKFQELNTLILHANFNTLVDYVECSYNLIPGKSYPNDRKEFIEKYNIPFWRQNQVFFRSKEAGIKALNDQIADMVAHNYTDHSYQEILDLYLWWTTTRPNRAELYVDSPADDNQWSNIDLIYGESLFRSKYSRKKHVKDQELISRLLSTSQKLEEEYNTEDTEMLVRLVKVLPKCWE